MQQQDDSNVRARKLINQRLRSVLGKGPKGEQQAKRPVAVKSQKRADNVAVKSALAAIVEEADPSPLKLAQARGKAQKVKVERARDVSKKLSDLRLELAKKQLELAAEEEKSSLEAAAAAAAANGEPPKAGSSHLGAGHQSANPLAKFVQLLMNPKGSRVRCPTCELPIDLKVLASGAGVVGGGVVGGQLKRKPKPKKKRKPNKRIGAIIALGKRGGFNLKEGMKKFKGVSTPDVIAML